MAGLQRVAVLEVQGLVVEVARVWMVGRRVLTIVAVLAPLALPTDLEVTGLRAQVLVPEETVEPVA